MLLQVASLCPFPLNGLLYFVRSEVPESLNLAKLAQWFEIRESLCFSDLGAPERWECP
jgi:hypothetical protein